MTQLNKAALSEFMREVTIATELLNQLRALADDHFCLLPDEVNWGHVDVVKKLVSDLTHSGEFLGIDTKEVIASIDQN